MVTREVTKARQSGTFVYLQELEVAEKHKKLPDPSHALLSATGIELISISNKFPLPGSSAGERDVSTQKMR